MRSFGDASGLRMLYSGFRRSLKEDWHSCIALRRLLSFSPEVPISSLMNIRSLSNPAQILGKEKVEADRKDIKSDQATDRDGNGQQAFGDQSGFRSLTEEELQEVVGKLKNHQGVQKHSLSVTLQYQGHIPFVELSDATGKLIKRLTERHLFDYLFVADNEAFSLVRRTA